jgi:GNAT superfamily N-acetyltransferase
MTKVTTAETAHEDAIVDLAEEMDRFYGATDIPAREVRTRQIREALFSDPPAAYAMLAWSKENLVGIASYSFLWPAAGLTKSLYLKELYVAESARRRGIGTLLMHNIFEVAAKYECSRVEWTADSDSPDTSQFYARIGAPINASKIFYRIEGEKQLLDVIATTAAGQG